MRVAQLKDEHGKVRCRECLVAEHPWARMRGLLGRTELRDGEGMLFSRTSSIHTFFMRFPIDVVFLDRDMGVVSIHPEVGAWKTAKQKGARWTLELAAGEAARVGIVPGMTLSATPV